MCNHSLHYNCGTQRLLWPVIFVTIIGGGCYINKKGLNIQLRYNLPTEDTSEFIKCLHVLLTTIKHDYILVNCYF